MHSSHSETQKLKCGVPQGSVLGARMYAMYAHPMSNIVNKHDISYHNYADDTQLYIACDNNKASVIQAVKSLEDCIADISEWMGCNSLKINEDKTEFVIFSRNPDKYSDITLQIGTDNIKSSDYVKILGVTLDSSMNMQKDIANTCRTTYMHIRKIRSIRCYLNEPATKSLVNATVISRLDYCNSLYIGLPLKSLYKLQLALNTAARLISGTHRHSHITPVLQQLNWLPIIKRCQFKILILTFKALHQQTPKYICDLFHWYTPTRALRSASNISLVASRSKTVRYGKRLIDTSSATLWNSLPHEIKCATNVGYFKNILKPYLASV